LYRFSECPGEGEKERRREGEKEKRREGEKEKRRKGEKEKRSRGEEGTAFVSRSPPLLFPSSHFPSLHGLPAAFATMREPMVQPARSLETRGGSREI
jgi:hypothetical protein